LQPTYLMQKQELIKDPGFILVDRKDTRSLSLCHYTGETSMGDAHPYMRSMGKYRSITKREMFSNEESWQEFRSLWLGDAIVPEKQNNMTFKFFPRIVDARELKMVEIIVRQKLEEDIEKSYVSSLLHILDRDDEEGKPVEESHAPSLIEEESGMHVEVKKTSWSEKELAADVFATFKDPAREAWEKEWEKINQDVRDGTTQGTRSRKKKRQRRSNKQKRIQRSRKKVPSEEDKKRFVHKMQRKLYRQFKIKTGKKHRELIHILGGVAKAANAVKATNLSGTKRGSEISRNKSGGSHETFHKKGAKSFTDVKQHGRWNKARPIRVSEGNEKILELLEFILTPDSVSFDALEKD